jgi:hypothetical protein
MLEVAGNTVIVGRGLTVIIETAVSVQDVSVFVPVTVYEVVVKGVTVILAVAGSPAGCQVYVSAPDAEILTEVPLQIV